MALLPILQNPEKLESTCLSSPRGTWETFTLMVAHKAEKFACPLVFFFFFVFSSNSCSSALIFHPYHEKFRYGELKQGPDTGLCWHLSTLTHLITILVHPHHQDWSQNRSKSCLAPPLFCGASLGLAALSQAAKHIPARTFMLAARPVSIASIREIQLGSSVLPGSQPAYIRAPGLLEKRVFYFDRKMARNLKTDRDLLSLLFKIC